MKKEKAEDATEMSRRKEATEKADKGEGLRKGPKGKLMTWLESVMKSFHLHGNSPN